MEKFVSGQRCYFTGAGSYNRYAPKMHLLFAILVVPVFTAMLWFTYTTNDSMTRTNAKDLMERFRFEATTNTQNLLKPIETMVGTSAALDSTQQQFFRDANSWDYLKDILSHSETTSSVYVGFEDGTFRMATRTTNGMIIQNQSVPVESTMAYRWIDRGDPSVVDSSVFDVFTFKNKQNLAVGATQAPATYDPR